MQKHQPALLGGVFIGILSSLPVINFLNCCCLWVIGGGMLVVYLQQQRKFEPVETGDAVVGGLIAGVLGGLIVAVASTLMQSVANPLMNEQFRQSLEDPNMPPEVRDMLTNLFTSGNLAVLTFALTVPLYAIFSMLGSLLGLAIFRKKLPPAAPMPPPMIQN
jgi:hypothetical protein